MSVLALLLALALERGLTRLFHLRELRWLDGWFDAAGRLAARLPPGLAPLAAGAALLLPVLPVAAVDHLLGSHLFGLLQFGFAVLVLLLSFGPRDLRDEVDDYVAALERGEQREAARRATELLESDAVGRGSGARVALEEAIFVQANNRIFGVMFWFMLLGPAGAWLFRVSDLMRRRTVFESVRRPDATIARAAHAATLVHGLLAWVPARLAALGYALAGSFEDAIGNWRAAVEGAGAGLLGRSEDLLARVGRGSLQPSLEGVDAAGLDVATARGAWRIVARAAWMWLAAIALLVLAGHAA